MPVGPSYDVREIPSRLVSASSVASPVIGTGRECGTSASSAPSVTTSWVPRTSASSTIARENVRQRIDGSGPLSRTRSRGARGTRAAQISTSGHSISRWRPSTRWIFGRVAWKSKNSSASRRAKRVAPSWAPRNWTAADAASPASFHPVKAPTSAGARRPSGRLSQMRGCIEPTVHNAPMATAAVRAIATLRAGDEIAGLFACTRKDRLLTRSGAPYLALELRDRTGALPARVFRDADVLGGRFERGDLVRVAGRVERFRDALQADLRAIARAPAGEADPAQFLPVAFRDLDELDGFLEHLAREVREPGFRSLVGDVLGEDALRAALRGMPATRNGHHAYLG